MVSSELNLLIAIKEAAPLALYGPVIDPVLPHLRP